MSRLLLLLLVLQIMRGSFSDVLSLKDTVTFRNRRNSELVSSGDDELSEEICSLSLQQKELFSPISLSINEELADCSMSSSIYDEYNVTINSPVSSFFTLSSTDKSVLFADYFKPETTYNVTVETLCVSCEVNVVELRFTLTMTDYTQRLLPHGDTLADDSLPVEDDGFVDVTFDSPFSIPVYEKRVQEAYISTNGLVTLESPQTNWYPEPFPYGRLGVPVLAPYWTDLNQTNSSIAAVYHNTYHRSSGNRAGTILSLASERVNDFLDEDFVGQWMLIVTWSHMSPYSNSSTNKDITFQLLLVTDYMTTYALYLYNDFNIDELVSSPVIGHHAADLLTYDSVEFTSSDSFLHMDTQTGNTGEQGQWIYDVSGSGDSILDPGETSCIEWAGQQTEASWVDNLPSCPCTKRQATHDWRYSFDQSDRVNCAVYIPVTTSGTVECCYDGNELISGSVEDGSSGYLRYHPVYSPNDYQSNDEEPYTDCCQSSNNCETFRIYRPSADCSGYTTPASCFAWGDPHFETFDGESYTFNGIGEFVLFSSISKDNLLVQIRLEKYESSQASVITAIAVKYKDLPTVQLELIDSKYQLHYNGALQSDLLPSPGNIIAFTADTIRYNDTLSEVDFENENYLVLRNINDTYIIVTSNGAAIRVGKELTFLHCTMEVSEEYYKDTKGLMGYYDNDPSNDYYLPNETTLSNDLTEKQLYNDFGLKWHIAKDDSLFTYTSDETYEDYNSDTLTFTPNFGTDAFDSNPTLKTQAEEQCEGDYSCLYDTAQTGDMDVGLETHKIRNSNKELEQELDDYPPLISGSPFRLIVHKQDEYITEYSARDPVTDETTVISIKDPVPDGVAINSTNHLSLNITTLPSNPLYLTTTDSNGTTSTQRVSILFCDCENNGSCIEDASFTPLDSNGHYRLPCDCRTGFGGLYCEDDFRGCSNDPCASYTTCEDDSVSDYGYKCIDCKAGYGYNDEEKCVDKNECLNGENDCSQQCTNSDGDYKCSCQNGFRLGEDGLTCNDINECAELNDGCDQICTNTEGGYECSCESTWDISNDGYTCNVNEPYNCQNCVGDIKCSANGNDITCACPKGERYQSYECHDCAEDKTGYNCQQNCNCLNGGTCEGAGCTCTEGYTGYDCGTEINDHVPVFSSDTVNEMELPEALPKLSSIIYIRAFDNDTGAAGEVTYSIVNTTYGLPLNVSNGVGVFTIGSTSGLLATAVPLADRIERTFLLMIEAKDGGVKPNSETHLLYISVVDKPLPQPLFSSNSYSEYIHENRTKGSVVVSDIECTEKDSISPEVVDLQIDITVGNTNSSFKIVNNELTIGDSLDYELVKRYDLELSCTNAFNNTADTNVTIVILNINDNPFEFDEPTYTIDVYENETKGYLLETLHASDADHPNLTVEYYLTDSHSGIFTLDSATGKLSIGSTTPFDREQLDNYVLEVTAHLLNTDSSIKHTVTTEVKITIEDINDYIPLFSKSLYTLTNLSQSNTKGETVVIVSASDKDLGSNAVIAYSIETNSQFDVNSTTGEVFISTGFLDKGTYTLSVYATDLGSPSLTGTSVIEVVVKATPNDIHFTLIKYLFNVSEDKAVGSSVGVAEAVLYDVANNSIESQLAYSLVDPAALPFKVNSDNGDITVLSSFDYEEQDLYEFTITASYPSHPSVPTATTTVQVTVTDINDNYPIFIPSAYSELLYDDTEVGTTVLSVHASDKDEDGGQEVLYSLAGSHAPFEINATNGAIILKTELDLPLDYHFTVTATDTGQPSLSNQTTVHVTVARRSVIHPLLSSTKIIFTLPESLNTPSGNTVGTVNALINGNVTIASEHGIGFRLVKPDYGSNVYLPFEIGMTSGVITTLAHSFDYESQDEYIFYVELYDIDDGTVHDTAPVIVKLLDVNDESPVFDEAIYSATISSTTETGTVVLTVSASDSDSGDGGDVVYSISPNNNGFHVDAFSGDISIVNSTVHPGEYNLVVTASDQGNPPLSTSVNVHFTVTGSTQNITFTEDTYVFSVLEGSQMDTQIGTISVSAINGDSNVDYDDLSFEIFPTVDCISNNGRVVIVGCSDLDREEQSVYNLTMKATHVSLVGVSGEVSVQVNIDDVNDNSPVFDKDVYPVIVNDDFNTSTILLSPVVVDDDLNSATMFSINTANTDIFTIDSNTGDITMSLIPAVGDYSFTIIATDEADITLSNTATVQVTVFKPGPKALEFVQSSLSHSVAENSPGETAIGVLQLLAPVLIDPSEYIGNLEFEILSGDNIDYFHIVNSNATLTLLNNFLDRETLATHVILVRAKFKTFQLSTEAYVTIKVNDTNDETPTFTKGVYAAELPNNSTTGTFVTVVSATDDDTGENADITYSILGNVTDFVIDSESGSVTTAVALTPGTNHKITVVATDQGVPQLSSTAIVSVVVDQAAPDSISFQSASYEFSFSENNDPGSHVGSVSITEDVTLLEGLVYEFITPSDPQDEENLDSFHLDAITGSVTALFSIDREDFETVEVSIRAMVPEQPSLTDTASIKITILDENDDTPTFTKSLYQVGDLTAGSISTSDTIVTVEAGDSDNGENGTISYALVDQVDFNIDSSGNIKVADKDIEAGTYKLTVTATDGGTTPLTGTTVVLVTINVPSVDLAFEYTTFKFNVPENTPPGSILSEFTLGLMPVNLDYISVLKYTTDDNNFILIGNGTHPDLYSTIYFDYEGPETEYDFTITATAEMENSNTITATSIVTVNVLNINDNAPQFTDVPADGYFQAEIAEGSEPYTLVIGPLAVTDSDDDNIKYELVDTFSSRFLVSTDNIITGFTIIDREETPLFMLTVEAIDDGDPPHHTSSVSVVVTVTDINDNSPSLISGDTYYASEEIPPGTVLFTVVATDPDEGMNGKVKYELEGTDYFKINATSGEVRSEMKLDYEDSSQQKDFELTLTLSDGGSDPQTVEETITVHVLNVLNDNRPKFINIHHPTVYAKATKGTFVTHVQAVDYDGNVLTYSLPEDESRFTINSHGNISKADDTELTEETIPLVVTVTDNSIYKLSSSVEITITVVDTILVLTSTTSSTSTPTHSITRSTTSTATATEPTNNVSDPPGTDGGGSGIIGFAIAAVFGVLFVLSVITIVVILVLTAGKRRERIKQKSQDPNDAAEENWILKDTNGQGKKDKKLKKKKTKGKQESTELERKNSLVDSSAYETMNEDETALMDLLPVPWGSGSNDHHYQADSEDNPSGAFKSSKKSSAKQPSKSTTPGSKTTPTKSLSTPSKPPTIPKPGANKALPSLNKPSSITKPTTTAANTSKGKTTPLNKPTTGTSSSGATKPKSTATKTSTPQKKPAVGKTTTPSKKPPSAGSKRSSNSSDPEGDGKLSPMKRRSRNKRASIDSTTSEFNNADEYLSLNKYGSGAPMARGERPAEYDIFLKPDDSGKPQPGARPSLDNLGWK